MTFNIVPVIPVGASYAEFLYGDTISGSSVSIPLGDPDSSRRIVALIGGGGGGIVTAASIASVSATEIASQANVSTTGYAYIAHVPGGTSGTLNVTNTGGGFHVMAYAIYEVGSNTPFDFQGSTGTSLTIDVPDRGLIVAARFYAAANATSWSGLTKDDDSLTGGGSISGAHDEFATAESSWSIGAAGGSLAFPVIIAVSFGP